MRELKELKLSELKPYDNNPRINDGAVEAVKESIKQCGYIAPIIVDEDYVILAGHTRYKALLELGNKVAQVEVFTGLTEEQKRKYRLLDNKTNEFASWDFDKLEEELDGLDFGDFDFNFEQENLLDSMLDEEFGHQFETDPVNFVISLTFPIDWKDQVEDYMAKVGGRDGIVNVILEEVRRNA